MHTPTPWTLEPTESRGTGGERTFKIIADRPYGGLIGETSAWWVDTQSAQANAEFIVTAVNSYEAMKEALIMARKKLELWPEGANPEYFPEVKAIDKALALAEGKE